ncbi:Disease resistance-like protein DSC1 [Citrus sinensis]|nr:Disease resistance-like protein DSC1 [Citrus sinensis]
MASSSSSSHPHGSLTNPEVKYDVFLSFRGEDTRENFTSHLYSALSRESIETFIDNDLRRGDEISQSLLDAIEASSISIIVFSERYASSRWCLDELLKILECKKEYAQIVIPACYRVDPSHVRKQTGNFGDSFLKLGERFPDKMQSWRNALTEAADLSGFDSRVYRTESALIEEIVNAILKRVDDTFQSENEDLVGVRLPMKEIESLLRTGSTNVYKLGIWGIGGIGKTTIAGAIFSKISRHFAGSFFARNVREAEETGRLGDLRQQLLSALLNDGNVMNFPNIDLNFQSKKLTRKQMKELVHDDALRLFSRHAFGGDHPHESHTELACKIIKYARGVPLAREVLGRYLYGKRREVWENAISKWETAPPKGIQDALKISYDGLDDKEQNVFLDIACFFIDDDRDTVTKFLDDCEFFATSGIEVLVDKHLITISVRNKIKMHDLLRAMGREIVRQESTNDPGKRSRLWHHKEGTEAIEGISLDMSKVKDINLHPNVFAKMPNLRILKFYSSMDEENKCKVSHFQGSEFTEVRYLHWHGYPLKSLPSNIHPEKLVLLEMPYSNIEQLFDIVQNHGKLYQIITAAFNFFSKTPTPLSTQHLNKLAILNLSGCGNLQSLPDRIHLELLKELNLSGCSKLKRLPEISSGNIETMHLDGTALEELPSSIECLSKLSRLDLADCKSLKSLPSGLCKLKSLDVLNIDGCSNLQRLPEELGYLEALDSLHAVGTAIRELPPSIVRLKSVRAIYFGRNRGLSLPITFSVDGLQNLRDLNLNDCGITELPESLGLLSLVTELHLEGNNFERIPESIIQLSNLEWLFIRYCERLQSLPKLPCNLIWLDAHHCTALESLPGLFPSSNESYLRTLYLSDNFKLDPNDLGGIVKGALQKIQLLATARLKEAREKISYPWLKGRGFLPWNEIPKWFSFQSVGSCVTLEMPPGFNDFRKYNCIPVAVRFYFQEGYPQEEPNNNQQTMMRNPAINNTNQHTQINFSFTNPIKLDRSNYLLWRSQVLASIRGNRLEDFITGIKSAPEESILLAGVDGSTQRIENPEYQIWRSQDQILLSWLLSTLSEGILSLVINCESSFSVWKALEKKFGVQSEARVLQLIYELNTLKNESLSIEDYCVKMKAIADKLASAGSSITEKDLMLTILNGLGLGSGYRDIATFITGSRMEFDNAYALLLTHETRLEQDQDDKSMFNANYAYTNAFHPKAYYAQPRGNFKRGAPKNSPSVIKNGSQRAFNSNPGDSVCQICFKPGHTAEICWHRFVEDYVPMPRGFGKGKAPRAAYLSNFDDFVPNPNFEDYKNFNYMSSAYNPMTSSSYYSSFDACTPGAAFMANFEGVVDDGWYLDSGATHHLTNNMENLQISEEFKGTDQLIIGNGQVSNFSQQQIYHLSILSLTDNSLEDLKLASSESNEQVPSVSAHTNNLHQQEHSQTTISEHSSSTIPLSPTPQQTESQPQNEPRLSNSQHINHTQTRNLHSQPSHSMVTISKSGIFKLKVYITTLTNKEPSTVQEALSDQNWHQAMRDEYKALLRNETRSLVPFSEAYKVVDSKWVFKIKQNIDGNVAKYKARLVAKGFQQTEGVDYFETFSPVVKACTVRIIFSLAVMNKWKIRQVDVNNAFLNKELTEDVYMRQPEGFINEKKYSFVCKLKKALYGLKQAPRAWYDKLKNYLIRPDSGELKKFILEFSTTFALKNLGILSYFLGIEVSYADGCIYLSQRKYINDLLSKADMLNCKGCDRYLKETMDYGLKFSAGGKMEITGFTDADWACDIDDRKSIGAYCIYFGNNLVSWSSKKQSVVTRSSAESEYKALASASAEIAWIQSLFSELNIRCISAPVIWCDNMSATKLAKNPVYHSRTKHIELNMHFVRDKVLAEELEIHFIRSEEQIADVLTKPLTFIHFNYFIDKLNVQPCPLSLRGAVKEAHNVYKQSAQVSTWENLLS